MLRFFFVNLNCMLGAFEDPFTKIEEFSAANFKNSSFVFKKCLICRKTYHSRFWLKDLKCRSCKILEGKKRNNTLNLSEKTKENISKSLKSKAAQDKRKKTNLQKYGYESPAQNPIVKSKIRATYIQKYGGLASSSKTIADKIKKTNEEKYGVENWTQSDEGRLKLHQSLSTKQSIEKRKETCLKRYEVESVKHLPNIVILSKCLYKYDDEFFDSSWELAFYIYHKDLGDIIIRRCDPIDYLVDRKIHKHFPHLKLLEILVIQ